MDEIACSVSQIVKYYYPYKTAPTPIKLKRGLEAEEIAALFIRYTHKQYPVSLVVENSSIKVHVYGRIDFLLLSSDGAVIYEKKNYPINKRTKPRVQLQLSIYALGIEQQFKGRYFYGRNITTIAIDEQNNNIKIRVLDKQQLIKMILNYGIAKWMMTQLLQNSSV